MGMGENLAGKGEIEGHEEGGPVDAVEARRGLVERWRMVELNEVIYRTISLPITWQSAGHPAASSWPGI